MRIEYRVFYEKEVKRSAPSRAASVLQRMSRRRLIAEAVDGAVREAAADAEVRVRADALLFLIVNFEVMIGYPLVLGDGSNEAELRLRVRDDTLLLLKHAAEHHTRAAQGEAESDGVSGHDIVSALADRWIDLWAASKNIWGT